nr:DUF4145 domain-containing protein [Salmonella enterica subsp. diarizonae]
MSWICPHCKTAAVLRDDDFKVSAFDLDSSDGETKYMTTGITCPNPGCHKPTIVVTESRYTILPNEERVLISGHKTLLKYPRAETQRAKDYPAYIPQGILTDYQEACAIVELSPKASATLARRCLQGMIRDFWKVKADTLFNEIQAIEEKVDPSIWGAIDSTRKVGNIGAHMEKDINLIIDVNPDEANLLIEMIEMLLDDWYIARHERAQKLLRIKQMAAEKAEARKG